MTNKVYHKSDGGPGGGTRLTPRWIVDLAIRTLGWIDLDPCAEIPEKGSPFNIPATRHFTIAHNGLMHTWRGKVYMNPPYGKQRGVDLWIDKLLLEYSAGNVTEAIVLLPARVGTIWWRMLRDFPTCFLKGRVAFVGFESGAGFPNSAHYLGDNIQHFYNVWSPGGDIYVRFDLIKRFGG